MTTTMIETFDTQMLDYQTDGDFSMHVSSSDPWFQDEPVMEDDSRSAHAEASNVSIEVDMEPYEEEHNLEYEMEDGSENFDLESTELVDIEVYDASRAQSPNAYNAATVALPASDSAQPLPISPELHESSTFHSNSHLPPTEADNLGDLPPPSESLAQPLEVFLDVPEIILTGKDLSPSPQVAGVHDTYPDVAEGTAENTVEEPHFEKHTDYTEAYHADHGEDIEKFAVVDAPKTHTYDSEASAAYEADTSVLPLIEGQHSEVDASAVSSGDPHEISEGVYIDPPPAVLISFPSETPSICLFNAPSKSRLSTPSASEPLPANITVLLGQLPTLYYEPLSSVFEALRQEEYFASIPHFLDGELLLDAYDLELMMSEDHTYAHELSLHDLNVLHDGLNKSGPLRLQLKNVGPRFIDRYHMLQEQVAHFNLSDYKEAPVESVGVEHPETEDTGDISHSLSETVEQPEEQEHEHAEETESGAETVEERSKESNHEEHENPTQAEDLEVGEDATQETSVEEQFEVQVTAENEDTVQEEYQDPKVETDDKPDDEDPLTAVDADGALGSDHPDVVDEAYVDIEEHHNENVDETYGETFADKAGPQEGEEAATSEHLDDVHEYADAREDVSTPRPIEHAPETLSRGNDTDNDPHHPEFADVQEDGANELGSTSTSFEEFPSIDTPDLNAIANPELESVHADNHAGSSINSPTVASIPEVAETGNPSYDPEVWDDSLDGEGELDTTWEVEEQEHETASDQSSTTLSSKSSSKRSISEAELEEYEDEDLPPLSSPGSKRPRVE